MDKFEAVVFDLDGTLLDTIEDLTDSVNAALQQYSCSLKTVDQVRSYVGNGIRNLMIRCIGQGERHPECLATALQVSELLLAYNASPTVAYRLPQVEEGDE